MPLALDSRLGAYKILSLIGEDAMGEVYRARDLTLGREVAIRALPGDFAKDPKRVERFRGEVQVLTTLYHPRIAGIYGLSESDGTHFLILEFVQGDTLAERLKAGPLALASALSIARQIGDALKVAHDKGIIHGDLKPAGVVLTTHDRVKVLDVGLARAMAVAAGQAEGKKTDKRDDVWGLGCVLYEMLAGKPAFAGDGIADWSALPADTPASIRTVIKGCLEKDLDQRIADIPTALSLLTEPAPAPAPAAPTAPTSQRSTRPAVIDPSHLAPSHPAPSHPAPSHPSHPSHPPHPSIDWRLVTMVAVPVVLVLGVATYLLVGRNRAQPDAAPAPPVEAPAPAPSPEVTATPVPAASSSVLLSNTRPPSDPLPRLTSAALDQAYGLLSSGSTIVGLQELDRLAEVSRYERSYRVPTDDERGVHRQLFLDRADRNLRIDPAKTDDSLRELIRVDPMYSPRLAAALEQRLDAVRSGETGTLQISSPVAGSTIRVNGALVGIAGTRPISVRVMPGEVEIRAHKDDYPRDGTSRASVTAGATVVVSDVAPRRIVQPVVLVVDRPDADVYVRKGSVDKTLLSLDPRVNAPTEVLLNRGLAQKPARLSVWKAQVPAATAADLERRLAAAGLDPSGVGVFVVPQEAIEYNRAIQVLFLRECYNARGTRIVLTEEFLKANDTAPLLWLGDAGIVRLAPDPGTANLPQCRALKP